MSLKIRLARGGAKKRPYYSIVVADSRSPRDGRFIEKLGTYNPMLDRGHKERVMLKGERVQHWIKVGALPSERVQRFLHEAGLGPKPEHEASAPHPLVEEFRKRFGATFRERKQTSGKAERAGGCRGGKDATPGGR